MPVAAIILPNGQIRHLSQEWGDCPCETSTKPVAYESFVEAVKRLGLFLQIVNVPREDSSRERV